jgi:hypothetical protein
VNHLAFLCRVRYMHHRPHNAATPGHRPQSLCRLLSRSNFLSLIVLMEVREEGEIAPGDEGARRYWQFDCLRSGWLLGLSGSSQGQPSIQRR